MRFQKTSIVAAASLASTVAAHGYVDKLVIAGTEYTGYQPYSDPYYPTPPARIVRAVPGNGPVQDLTSIDIQCNGYSEGGVVGSKPAPLVGGPVAAGEEVSLNWTLWPESHVGPTITYMALCDGDCTTYEPGTAAVWFKVAEMGRVGTSNVWGSTQLMTAPSNYKYTIPSCLKAGNYLVRHETIALHSAYAYPGAQWYPSCHQIQVTGSGTSTGPSSKVAFPGAYSETDPGIVYDSYKAQEYIIPGPALFIC
ncbi:hypothetical protein V500_06907 [Pseudogymnoascus sp. VKM F-4518 (FW-2643)]|nr:hypothetical protein V500_06907 [Pseudogymnoascus sp. VKM F-4518 (FW-2643)]